MPRRQVSTFHRLALSSAAMTTVTVTALRSTVPAPIVPATATPKMQRAAQLSQPDHPERGARGHGARCDDRRDGVGAVV